MRYELNSIFDCDVEESSSIVACKTLTKMIRSSESDYFLASTKVRVPNKLHLLEFCTTKEKEKTHIRLLCCVSDCLSCHVSSQERS